MPYQYTTPQLGQKPAPFQMLQDAYERHVQSMQVPDLFARQQPGAIQQPQPQQQPGQPIGGGTQQGPQIPNTPAGGAGDNAAQSALAIQLQQILGGGAGGVFGQLAQAPAGSQFGNRWQWDLPGHLQQYGQLGQNPAIAALFDPANYRTTFSNIAGPHQAGSPSQQKGMSLDPNIMNAAAAAILALLSGQH